MQRVSMAALFACAACVDTVELTLPDTGQPAILLAIEPELRIYAIDTEAEPFVETLTYRDEPELTVLAYAASLAELFIPPGLVEEVLPGEGRALPEPQRVLHRTASGAWEMIPSASERVMRFRLRDIDARDCLLARGCFVGGACKLPCPDPPAVLGPTPPSPPIGVDMRPCPRGWTARGPTDVNAIVCDPPPPLTCSASTAQFLGESSCTAIGRACGSPSGAFYVDAAAMIGGDGSEAAPFRTIEDALAAAPAGSIIALARGAYREHLAIAKPVTIAGACSSDTAIDSLTIASPGVVIRDVSIVGGDPAIGVVSGALELRGAVVDSAGNLGVSVFAGAELVADSVVVRNQALTLVRNDGRLALSRSILGPGRGTGLVSAGVAVLTATTTIIRDIEATAGGAGYGLVIDGGAAELDNLLVDHATAAGIICQNASTSTLTHVVIRDTDDQNGTGAGRGLFITASTAVPPHFRGSKILLADNPQHGLYVGNGDVKLSDVAISGSERVMTSPDDPASDGIPAMLVGGQTRVERMTIDRYVHVGMLISTASAAISDLEILGPRPELPNRVDGHGISVGHFGHVRIDRARVVRPRAIGVLMQGTKIDVALDSIAVLDPTTPPGDEKISQGMLSFDDTTVTLRNSLIQGAEVRGFAAGERSRVFIDGVEVKDNGGHGLLISERANVEVRRSLFLRNRGAGIQIDNDEIDPDGGTLLLENVSIRGTAGNVEDRGVGLSVNGHSIVTADRFEIEDSASEGVFVGARGLDYGPEVDLRRGIISGSSYGLFVLPTDYDLERLLNEVKVTSSTPINGE